MARSIGSLAGALRGLSIGHAPTMPAPLALADPDFDQAEPACSPWTLRFRDQDVEMAFQLDAAARQKSEAVTTVLMGAATWAAAAVLLPLLFTVDVVATTLAIGLVESMVVPLLFVVRRARTFTQVQVSSALVNLIGGIAIILIAGFLIDVPALVAPALLVNIVFAFAVNRYGPIGVAFTAPYVVLFAALAASGRLPNGEFETFLVLSAFFVATIGAYQLESTARNLFWQRQIIAHQGEEIAREKDKSERLLLNVLPGHIVPLLRENPTSVADRLPDVTVLFADLVGFTRIAGALSPDRLVLTLDELFGRFDALAEAYGLEKIKTIGDAYMAVAGAHSGARDHARRAVEMGLAMISLVADYGREVGLPLTLRVGVHSGPVVAGVLGKARLSYDLWGDTVNVASRMESQGTAGAVQVSASTAAALGPDVALDRVGLIDVRGKGPMETFLIRPEARDDASPPSRDGAAPPVERPAVRRRDAGPLSLGMGARASQ